MWIVGLVILVSFYGLGEALHQYLHIPLPGNVLGMILLLAALFSGIVRLEWGERATGFSNRPMLRFFVPVIVGVVGVVPALKSKWALLVAVLFVSTWIPLVISGWAAEARLRAGKREERS